MKMRHLFFCLIVGILFAGCTGRAAPEPESRLYQEFALGKIVKRMAIPGLQHESGGSGASDSPGIKRRKDFSDTYMIDEAPGARFNEAQFMMQLRLEMQKLADDSGARRQSEGFSGDGFNFDYSTGHHEGWVEVVGARTEGNRFKIWSVIRENTKHVEQ
jgi:hypothetical protein